MIMDREKLMKILPYSGLPIILAAMLLLRFRDLEAYDLLRLGLVVIFGYVAALSDLKSKRIPNNLILIMLMAWPVIIIPGLFLDIDAAVGNLVDSALGFAIGGGLFLIVYLVSRKGIGGGDVKFMAVAGLYLGFDRTLPAILYGTILAALTGLALIACKKISRKDKIPLAPFLYAGILVTVLLQ